MSLKAKVEAIIYAAEEPVTLDQISVLLKDIVLADLASTRENAAIEQADSAAEAADNAAHALEASDASSAESTTDKPEAAVAAEENELLPELAIESAEPIDPEPGPLMPGHSTSDDENSAEPATSAHSTQSETPAVPQQRIQETPADVPSEENTVQEPAPESADVTEISSAAQDSTSVNDSVDQSASVDTEPTDAVASDSASVNAPESTSRKRQPKKTEQEIAEDKAVRARVRQVLVELITDYASEDRGMEIRQVAGGFRMATKPEHHDVVRAFAKSLKPPIRLSLAALETLAVVAYKQPITGPEIADIRGVESASVLGTLLDRKLITTAGRKQVIGRPMQYKTSKDFLMRFGLNDVNELPSMEEFSQLASDGTIEIAPPETQDSLFESSAQNASQETEKNPKEPDIEAPGESQPEGTPVDSSTDYEAIDQQQEIASPDLPGVEAIPAAQQTDVPELELPAAEEVKSEDWDSSNESVNDSQDEGSSFPESESSGAAEAADSQPQSDAESSNVPEAEHPIGK